MHTGTASISGAGDTTLAPVRPGEVVAEKYRVESTLGVGGMGVVVAAEDLVLERRVAIKFLLPRLAGSETAVQRFVREGRAATRITSEHVVRLLEIDKLPSGTPFFVMEYLKGRDLRAVLREDGPLAPSVAVDHLLQALQAVAEGHLKGIVHRDIKPGNLFLTTRADGTPLIKVLDFGIAKRLESHDEAEQSSLTSSDDVRLGSPAYMPPEQLQDPRDVDTRSDIWSIGATLYELMCGKPPFDGPSYLELVSRILSAPPKPISDRKPPRVLPKGLEQVLLKCLQKERTLRYANAAELAAALAPFGSDDARMSLTRVIGLHALPAPTTPRARVISDSGGSCTTTLPVAAENQQTSRDSQPSGAQPRVSGKRGWIVVAAAVAVVALGLTFRGAIVPSPSKTPATAALAPAARAVVNPAAAPSEPAAPAPPSDRAGAHGSTPSEALAIAGGRVSPPASTKSTSAPPRTVGVSGHESGVKSSTASEAARAPAVTVSAPPTPATSPPTVEQGGARPNDVAAAAQETRGRSREIERLIESRR